MVPRLVAVALLLAACTHPPARRTLAAGAPPAVTVPAPAAAREAGPWIDFAREVRPILEARCQPCHFAGGRMYETLPFDREETVHHLGDKLFTRIKAEDERRVIRALLAQGRSRACCSKTNRLT